LIHESQHEYDAEHDDFLREWGYQVLRIPADQIRRDLPASLEQIDRACGAALSLERPHN
jgi:very-short-patch-repair endonuclease